MVKGAGMMYSLEMERECKRSDHGCNCRKGRHNVPSGGEREYKSKRLNHSCDWKGGRQHTNWR
jgi:hypothetical protein